MEVTLCSLANDLELLELLDVTEATQLSSLWYRWRKRTYQKFDYETGPADEGTDFVLFNPWERGKIDHTHTPTNLATHVAPEDINLCWGHEGNEIERTKRDESRDYNGYVKMTDSLLRMNQAPNQSFDVCGISCWPQRSSTKFNDAHDNK